ncbi:MAG: glycoside hydrolase family 88 protein [Bacteroidetes bacterium]|nr:glycoside hydrolase family 88 protein [Bacteroidota bacterium]
MKLAGYFFILFFSAGWAVGYPVIIDNQMNLGFLFRATAISGDSSTYRIAVGHANTDLKYRWRADNSSYYILDFDPGSGGLLRRMTHRGYSDSSCRARGQAWGIYGYTVLYRETKDRRYLEQAIKAVGYFLCRTDSIPDPIPYWDFQDPEIPNAPRDASAAAVAASGMIGLSRYAGCRYLEKARRLVKELGSAELSRGG